MRCHHQAVDLLAPRLVATGWAADGTVEALDDPAHPFAVGVQSYPEEDATELRLVTAPRRGRPPSSDHP